MKYIVRINYHIEAKNARDAEDEMIYNNVRHDKILHFDEFELEEAKTAYLEVAKELQPPKSLGNGLYWFSGVSLIGDDDEYLICEEIIDVTVRDKDGAEE